MSTAQRATEQTGPLRARRGFTLIELLLACGLILFIANVILRLFSQVVDLTQSQVGTLQIYNTAMTVLNQAEQDIRGMRTRNAGLATNEVQLLGNFTKGGSTADTHTTTGDGYARLALVTSCPESRLDQNLAGISGVSGSNTFDGYVLASSDFKALGGLKEVCFFLKSSTGTGSAADGLINDNLLTLYRTIRSPIATTTTTANLFSSNSAFAHSKSILAKNVIYFGVRYLTELDGQPDFLGTGENVSTWTSLGYPDYIEVTISLATITASAQQEGRYNDTDSILLTNDHFRAAVPGYFADLTNGRVYKYKKLNINGRTLGLLTYGTNDDWYVVDGCPATKPSIGDRILFGTTFTRRIPVGQ